MLIVQTYENKIRIFMSKNLSGLRKIYAIWTRHASQNRIRSTTLKLMP